MTSTPPPQVPLKFISTIVSGGTPSGDASNWDGDIPFITPPDLNGLDGGVVENWDRSLTEQGVESGSVLVENAVLLSCRAPIGHIGLAPGKVAFNQGCKAIIPNDSVDLRYLAHCLVADRGALQAAGRGTTFMELSNTELSAHSVPWPSPQRRAAIADYLDRETGEIGGMITKLDDLAKMLHLRRDAAVANEIDPHYGRGTIPLAFASSPERFFDGDWVESKDQDPNGNIRLLQLADVGAGRFLDKSDRWINQEAFERLQCRELSAGDVLIARMPDPLGRACVLPPGLGRSITVVDVAVLRPDPKKLLPEYLVYVLNGPTFRSLVDSLQSGSTRQRISRSRLGQQRIPAPPVDEQHAAIARLDEVTGRIDAMLAKVADLRLLLTERRTALITDVVAGQKEVA